LVPSADTLQVQEAIVIPVGYGEAPYLNLRKIFKKIEEICVPD
jgi:hypothetical protein